MRRADEVREERDHAEELVVPEDVAVKHVPDVLGSLKGELITLRFN